MSGDWNASPWSCAGPVGVRTPKAVSLEDQHGVPAYVLPPHRNPKDVARRLKPEKWRSVFDYEGRPVGFQKLLKSISQGGVDHSIRTEVWEFLLGCYTLGSTAKYRQELRAARRERYQKLIDQCRQMHASIGTGTLAYTVGSKVMDVRMMSKDKEGKRVDLEPKALDDAVDKVMTQTLLDGVSESPPLDTSTHFQRSYHDVAVGFDTVYTYRAERPVTGVVQVKVDCEKRLCRSSRRNLYHQDLEETGMPDAATALRKAHFLGQVNSDHVAGMGTGISESVDSSPKTPDTTPKRLFVSDAGPLSWSAGSLKRIKSRLVRNKRKNGMGTENGPLTRGVAEDVHGIHYQKSLEHHTGSGGGFLSGDRHEPVAALGKSASEERVAEWLCILHRIVVDVVRTDRHLEFYGDAKNMARMSDILAVYAWIDPETGYCQGMSDLLSPFIVLFDDNADAFWCFESLLRRVRHNFQMEGPVGVMKQLEALSKILEVTDPQMLKHLAVVGADNFLFAFRMLLVLFRRELPFSELLLLWEMMWAVDFNQTRAWALEFNCLEALALRMPSPIFQLESQTADDTCYMAIPSLLSSSQQSCSSRHDILRESTISNSSNLGAIFPGRSPFCGFRPGALLMRNPHRMPTVSTSLGRDGDEELSVFCVAAILVQNRSKFLKEVQSMDDAIKAFNEMNFIIHVHSSINTAVKLRKKYRNRGDVQNF